MSNRPKLAGVLGWPVGHSRSPQLHGCWLRRYNIDGFYIPVAVEPGQLEASLAALATLGFRGVNVTLPHKTAALSLAEEMSETARRIGAANTLVFQPEGGFHADNTDAYGFLENIGQTIPDWNPSSGPALVLGAGGASRAVVDALATGGSPEVRVSNRTLERTEALAAQFGPPLTVVPWNEASDAAAECTTIVNTTSLGMKGSPPLEFHLGAAPSAAVVNDIVYTPLETDLLREARERGLAVVDGLGMLLHQAAPGFRAWFGVAPEVDDNLRRAVLDE